MSIKIYLTSYFNDIVGNRDVLEADGGTVGEVIENIDKEYPGFRDECIDGRGKLYGFFEVYINGETAFPDELNRKLSDRDEVTILTMAGGG